MADERTVTEHPGSARKAKKHTEIGVLLLYSGGPVPVSTHRIADAVTIGRDEAADLSLEDSGASRSHARLGQRESALWVTDLGSRNGTFLNSVRVPAEGALAAPHAVIRVSKTLLMVKDILPYLEKRPREVAGLLGGAALDDVRFCIETIAPTNRPVLILGETGTGKEVIAGAIHARSGREGPFVALNCAAVAPNLVDAELFGHVKGAFSDAVASRSGLFRRAHGGTLFLDEIGEMPAPVQAKLLRVLETNEVRPVGDDRPVRVDVRVVAATNRDVDSLLASGTFRSDVVHRLSGLRIEVPPLRKRREDVPVLAAHFLGEAELQLSAPALERLILHEWPGNVRELRNIVTAAAEIARLRQNATIELEDLPTLGTTLGARPASEDEEESARMTRALIDHNGDVAASAKQLSMSRSALYQALRRLKIDPRACRRRS